MARAAESYRAGRRNAIRNLPGADRHVYGWRRLHRNLFGFKRIDGDFAWNVSLTDEERAMLSRRDLYVRHSPGG